MMQYTNLIEPGYGYEDLTYRILSSLTTLSENDADQQRSFSQEIGTLAVLTKPPQLSRVITFIDQVNCVDPTSLFSKDELQFFKTHNLHTNFECCLAINLLGLLDEGLIHCHNWNASQSICGHWNTLITILSNEGFIATLMEHYKTKEKSKIISMHNAMRHARDQFIHYFTSLETISYKKALSTLRGMCTLIGEPCQHEYLFEVILDYLIKNQVYQQITEASDYLETVCFQDELPEIEKEALLISNLPLLCRLK